MQRALKLGLRVSLLWAVSSWALEPSGAGCVRNDFDWTCAEASQHDPYIILVGNPLLSSHVLGFRVPRAHTFEDTSMSLS